MRYTTATALALGLAAAGCSSSGTSTDMTPGTCSVVLSGGVSGTIDCTATAVYANSGSLSTITITASTAAQSATIPFVDLVLTSAGQVTATTYTQNSAGLTGALSVTKGSVVWAGSVGGGAPVGQMTLTVTSVTTLSISNSGVVYTIHGNGLLVLPATASSSGTVTISVTF